MPKPNLLDSTYHTIKKDLHDCTDQNEFAVMLYERLKSFQQSVIQETVKFLTSSTPKF